MNAGKGNSTKASIDGRWSEENQGGTIPIASGKNGPTMSSYNIENSSYLRLKNISLGYTLPKKLVDKVKIQNLRVYISGQNLFTITNYSG